MLQKNVLKNSNEIIAVFGIFFSENCETSINSDNKLLNQYIRMISKGTYDTE